MPTAKKYLFLLLCCFLAACNSNKKILETYQNHLKNLPRTPTVTTANGMIIPEWRKTLNHLDGVRLPRFEGESMTGGTVKVNYKGKPFTLLNFWFISCPPCVEEIPYLNQLQKEYGDRLQIISIGRDSKEEIERFMLEHPMQYTIVPNGTRIIEDVFITVNGYPKNYLTDSNGKVLKLTRGFRGTDDGNYKTIVSFLKK